MDTFSIRKGILNQSINIDELINFKKEIVSRKEFLVNKSVLTDEEFQETKELLMILLDYYTYSENGDVLISDHEYDCLMRHYINNGGQLITKADKIENKTQWEFIKHEYPGMVGSIRKIYEFDELVLYFQKYRIHNRKSRFIIAPKFDGISSAIKIDSDANILLGVTRNNGIEGQNITQMIRKCQNAKNVASYYASLINRGQYAWVKTELIVSTEEFQKLCEEKDYKNRRSATAGIVNSPKNVDLAKYVTILPLAAHLTESDRILYSPVDSFEISVSSPYELMDEINKMLSIIRDSSYPIRTDGVVIYPCDEDILPNFNDIMDNAIAFKVNTEEALSKVDFGYVSIGRLGFAVPMLRIHPCEVNETTVTDVSLGSFDKFVNMDIHEGEQVLIYSAGNVIPQAKLPEDRHYPTGSPLLKIKKVCPYCNEKLSRYSEGTYRCENPDCPKIKSGRIANFVIKLKAENVSDKTIDDLVENHLIEDIPDLFDLSVNDIKNLPGYGEDSATMIVSELNKIRTKEITVSSLLGALGISGISEKKCQKIFKVMPLDKMLKCKKENLKWQLLDAESTGLATAGTFCDFLFENKSLIKRLLSIMNIVNDRSWKGNVVFTGSRDTSLEEKIMNLNYEISNNVNDKTVAVVDFSYNHDSTKCKAARKKGIDIIHVSEIDKLLKELKKR